ncbi:MAG: hypothetical protein ACFFEY_03055 [Candidatus Thorarchaeota archaeon]
MAYKELNFIIENLQNRAKEQELNLKSLNNVLVEFLETQNDKFEEFKENVKQRWNSFLEGNQKRIIKKPFSSFFYENLHDLLRNFLYTFFGFDQNSLDLLRKEKISEKVVFFEYNYILHQTEEKLLIKLTNKYRVNIFYEFSLLTGHLYFLVRVFGTVIRNAIQEKFFVLLDAVIVKDGEKNKILNFLIVCKDSKDEIFDNYYNMVLYYFLRQFKGIPEEYFDKLYEKREELYQIALNEYSSSKEKLVDLLYYFYKKCNLLQSFSPLLDFFNFVGARVEDSIFSKLDIIKKEFLINLDYSTEKKNAIIKLFDYLDKISTLYSTFQANNLPSSKSQLNLFLLYMKYYLGSGLEALEVGDLLFFPQIFKTKLNQYNETRKEVIGANSIENIKEFINFLSNLSNISSIDLFFYKIFKKSISQLNYDFFKTFLRSFNSNFSQKIDYENELLAEDPNNTTFSFNIIVDHICRILYVLIDKIFIRSSPDEASANFIDPRSRYVGKNIALRVLELFVFQDINYSDDVWPDYIISLNRDQLQNEMKQFNITIPKKYFYSLEELIQIMITYNIQSFLNQSYHEEWLISEVIIPLNDFILKIRDSVKDSTNEKDIYNKLSEFFLSDIKDKEKVKEFEFFCQQLALFWKKVE